jgi:hypothetical protein
MILGILLVSTIIPIDKNTMQTKRVANIIFLKLFPTLKRHLNTYIHSNEEDHNKMFKLLADAKTMTSSKITGRNAKTNLLQACIQMKPTNY